MDAQEATRMIRRLHELDGEILVLQHEARLAGLTVVLPMFDEAEAQLRAIQTVIDDLMTGEESA